MAHKDFSFIDKMALWKSTEIKLMGALEIFIALMFLVPALYAVLKDEDPMIFLLPIPALIAIGLIQFLLFGVNRNLRTVNGLIMVALAWLVMFLEGSIPFMLAGMTPVNALFESVNGFTTTGSSTVWDINMWPDCLLFWRSLSQWIGGIAVVVIFIYVLPMFGMGRTFFGNELEGSGTSRFSMKLRNAAKNFILVYILLTLLNFVLLLIFGNAPLEDSVCLSLTTISTGGLIISNDSIVSTNFAVKAITLVFMLVGGINFYLHYNSIIGRKPGEYLKNRELKLLLLYFFAASLIIFFLMVINNMRDGATTYEDYFYMYGDVLFTVVSMGTTTGFAVYDYSLTSELIMFIFIMLMLVGSCAGSTSGGIKFTRIRIVLVFFMNTFKNILHPNAVYTVKVDNEDVTDSRVMGAVSITLLYIMTVFLATIVLLSANLNWVDALSVAVGSVTNSGVGFGNFGPFGTYVNLDDGIKIFLMLLMWMGRLEITLALVFFTRSFWHEVRYSFRSSRRKNIQ